MKNRIEGEPCRVVSTSLMEAGVDVDFPTVYREEAGLDSVLQAAGRCNREGKRSAEDSLVCLFRLEGHTPMQFRQQIDILRETECCYPDLTGRDAISAYFTALFGLRPEVLDQKRILKALLEGINGCEFPFRQVSELVRLIDDRTVPVVVPCEEVETDVRQLLQGQFGKQLLRKLGKHSVNVYPQHLQELLDCGAVIRVDEDAEMYVLLNTQLYREETGLAIKNLQGTGFML